MDKMTIVGSDGKSRYVVEGTEVKDLTLCTCPHPFPSGSNVTICDLCDKPLAPDTTSQEEK
jgi:hypothetical protein